LILLVITSCRKNEELPPTAFTPYISAYTSGLITPESTIKIALTEEQAGIEANTEITEKLFLFSPSIKGKTYWTNARTIEFIPEEGALKSGKVYKAEFKLGKIIKVDKDFKVFRFSFKVEEKNFNIHLNPLDISDPTFVTVKGEILSGDKLDPENLKKAFSAKTSDNQVLSPEIVATDDSKTCRFVIEKVKRGETDIDLQLAVDGKWFGADKIISESILIPALDVFKALSAELIYEPEEGIQISFSDPVSTSQDLNGLISLSEISGFTTQVQNNKVNVFFDKRNAKETTLTVDAGIKNVNGEKLQKPFSIVLILQTLKPQVEILKSGNIMPNSGSLILPFSAASLKAVDLKVIKIFENNILMFLQNNRLDGDDELRRSGRLVYKKTIVLDSGTSKDLLKKNNYSVDLSGVWQQDPGAVYRVELSFKKAYSVYPCDDDNGSETEDFSDLTQTGSGDEITEKEENLWDTPQSYYYSDSYDWQVYKWDERDNPCKPSYYMSNTRNAAVNVFVSDIGILAKNNSGNKWWITASSISDTKPIANADIIMYNYQLQVIGNAKTDSEGFALVEPAGKAFVLVAKSGGQKTYLRLVDGEDNSLNRFDIGGKVIEKGLKGFIYGERGVWRPGDTLYVTFVLHDSENRIPENHPVSLEMYNPQGQFYAKQISTKGLNNFYTFSVPTKADDPTGLWNAYVKVGGASFHKSFRIETVKPNRLKINLTLPGQQIETSAGNISASLASNWLTGATAHNLKTKVEMTLTRANQQFKGYEKYVFNNPATQFTSSTSPLFEGSLNEEGVVKFELKPPKAEDAPGMLNADIICRVFEEGGDASVYTQNIPFSPFSSYVGVNLNQEKNKHIDTDTDHVFDVVTLNSSGKPVNINNLEYKIYRIGWSWWWENNDESFTNYINNTSYKPVAEGKLQTINGKANFKFNLKYPDWGRYLVYVKDNESGHASGGIVYIDWPDWRGRSKKSDPDGLKMLTFSTDKTEYEVGEDVTVIIPASAEGTAVVALENGSTVLSATRINVPDKEDTKYTFRVTPEMAPNFYIHISLLQPHSQTVNDLPIRMYGVIPVLVSNKESKLNPEMNMPDVLRPETEFTVEVSEKNGKEMTYTLAVVDDGLLDLTNFKTPNPWNEFYAREALGIRTWDMYDNVMGAFGGQFSGMFSIGGDEMLRQADAKSNRFKPVVKFLGPFTLNKGGKNRHDITLPVYVGSVRTMIVAGQNGAYGKTEKTTPVRSPLMILSSLPRVLSTNEEVVLPVNIFAMENSVKDVSVKIETTGLLQAKDGDKKSVVFSNPGDKIIYFSMKTGSQTGGEKVIVTATGGGKTAKETIEISVRNPNPAITVSDSKLIEAGQSGEFKYKFTGNSGDDWVKLEASRIPSVNVIGRFDFLHSYEHYCTEQLVSTTMPLLFISQFKEMDAKESESVKKNTKDAIQNLYGRQLQSGGFVYWPGQSNADSWICSYAGTFLLMAKEKGYEVNEGVLNRWKSYQKREAQNWSPAPVENYASKTAEIQQAYRLYSLALANAPELGAMNRLKESKNLSQQARWSLAAAYAVNGKKQPAEELIFNIPTTVEPYFDNHTYGSSSRDEALILQTLVLMNRSEDAFKQAQKIAAKLSVEQIYTTQSTAYSLMALGSLAEKTSGNIVFNWTLNGNKQDNVKSTKAAVQMGLPQKPAEGTVSLNNEGKGILYVNLVSKTKPVVDTFPAINNNLRMEVAYADLDGKAIDISEITQGADLLVEIKLTNTGVSDNYTDLALTHIIPSGWEVFNERMTKAENDDASSKNYTYRDIRDDRILTYFDLAKGQTKIIKVRLQALYEGSFVLPAIRCEAMYDTSVQARTTAGKVIVKK
jgi:uncharacterized protein YfaS (alpha-2-macroglobulin family)